MPSASGEASDSAPLFKGVGLTPNSQNVKPPGAGLCRRPSPHLYLGIQAVRCFGSFTDLATIRLFGCRHDGSEDCDIFTDKLIALGFLTYMDKSAKTIFRTTLCMSCNCLSRSCLIR